MTRCSSRKISRKGYTIKKGSRKGSRVSATCVRKTLRKSSSTRKASRKILARKSSTRKSSARKSSARKSSRMSCKSDQVWRRAFTNKKGTRVSGRCKKASQPTDYMHRRRWSQVMNLVASSSNPALINIALDAFVTAAEADPLGIAFIIKNRKAIEKLARKITSSSPSRSASIKQVIPSTDYSIKRLKTATPPVEKIEPSSALIVARTSEGRDSSFYAKYNADADAKTDADLEAAAIKADAAVKEYQAMYGTTSPEMNDIIQKLRNHTLSLSFAILQGQEGKELEQQLEDIKNLEAQASSLFLNKILVKYYNDIEVGAKLERLYRKFKNMSEDSYSIYSICHDITDSFKKINEVRLLLHSDKLNITLKNIPKNDDRKRTFKLLYEQLNTCYANKDKVWEASAPIANAKNLRLKQKNEVFEQAKAQLTFLDPKTYQDTAFDNILRDEAARAKLSPKDVSNIVSALNEPEVLTAVNATALISVVANNPVLLKSVSQNKKALSTLVVALEDPSILQTAKKNPQVAAALLTLAKTPAIVETVLTDKKATTTLGAAINNPIIIDSANNITIPLANPAVAFLGQIRNFKFNAKKLVPEKTAVKPDVKSVECLKNDIKCFLAKKYAAIHGDDDDF